MFEVGRQNIIEKIVNGSTFAFVRLNMMWFCMEAAEYEGCMLLSFSHSLEIRALWLSLRI